MYVTYPRIYTYIIEKQISKLGSIHTNMVNKSIYYSHIHIYKNYAKNYFVKKYE